MSTTASTPAGTYPITITGTSGSLVHTAGVSLTVTPSSTSTVPGTPAAPRATAANGKGVNVAWSAPSNTGGSPITGYRLYRGTTSTSQATLVATLGNVTSFKDTTTARGTTYYYAVSAVNAVGPSAKSPPSAAVRAK